MHVSIQSRIVEDDAYDFTCAIEGKKGTALKVEKKVEFSEPVRHHFEKLNDESIDCKTGWTVSSV